MRRIPDVGGWPGIGITVTFPRWMLRAGQMAIGGLLLLMIAAAVLAIAITGTRGGSGSSAAFGIGVRAMYATTGGLQVTAEVNVGPGDGEYPNEGWSILFADGAISRGRVVDGPAEFDPASKATVVIAFGAREGAEPLALRYDPGGGLGMSIPLR